MKPTPIFLFFISLFAVLFAVNLHGQVPPEEVAQDTIITPDTTRTREKYGLRLGLDLSKPLRTFFEDNYRGLEIVGDYRVYDNFYAAAELGNESLWFEGDNISVNSTGSYAKIGADYNAYQNWAGMQNLIFAGLRYGFSTFTQELEEYRIYTTSQYFGPDIRRPGIESSGLTANWVELVAGIKVEILNNLYLSANVQLKRRLFETSPNNLDNLTIPGFNRTFDGSNIGVGYGYTISYLIPFYRR